ncbi:MAG: ankyrin repeat domain-containing protein [Methyloceanibacter sp.]
MSAYRLQLAASGAVLVASIAFATSAAVANAKVCRSQEQRYEQIERDPTSVEINAALFSAADKGCTDLARNLLELGASLDARDRTGARPLARAAVAGEVEMVTLFLDRGAAIDAQNLEGSSALFQAAENGRLPVVKLLVERGANVGLPGRSGITPLAAAAYMGSVPIIELLMEKGADAKTPDNTGKAAIIYAAGRGFSPVVHLLLDHGVDVNARYGNDLTALMWAAGYSEEAGVQDAIAVTTMLLDSGGHIDDADNRGRTALMIAAELNHAEAVDLLIARGADKTLKDKEGKRASDLTTLTALRDKLAANPN